MKFRREAPEFRAYKKALFYDLIWWQGRQLTTGPAGPTYGPRSEEAFPQVRTDVPIALDAPCSCRYGLYRVTGAPGPWLWTHRPGIRRPEPLTAAFRIDPACPHHGDRR